MIDVSAKDHVEKTACSTNDRLKILVVQESDWIQRGPHQSHHLMENLAQRGHDVRVLDFAISWRSQNNGSLLTSRLVIPNVKRVTDNGEITLIRPAILMLPLMDYLSAAITHYREIKAQLNSFRPDVVVGLGILNSSIGLHLARSSCTPFVFFVLDELHRLIPERRIRGLGKLLEQHNIRSADCVLAIGHSLTSYCLSMGSRKNRTGTIETGVDTKRIRPDQNRRLVRERYRIGEQDILVLYMGWLYDFSGLTELVNDYSRNRDVYENMRIMIIGRGEAYARIEMMISENGLGNQIVLLPWQEYGTIPDYLAAADICILPASEHATIRNVVPIKVLEYLAAGKPVISTRLSGVMEEFGHENGVVYADTPASVLTTALNLSRDKEDMRQKGLRARAYAESHDWSSITKEFEQVLIRVSRDRANVPKTET